MCVQSHWHASEGWFENNHASGGGFENNLRSQQRLLREPGRHCRRLTETIETDYLADTTEKDKGALCERLDPITFIGRAANSLSHRFRRRRRGPGAVTRGPHCTRRCPNRDASKAHPSLVTWRRGRPHTPPSQASPP